MAATAWFALDIDEVSRQQPTATGAPTKTGEVVMVERARGDCCGCCGPLGGGRHHSGVNGPIEVPFLDTRFVGGVVAFVGGVLSAALLVVLVWSMDSFGGESGDELVSDFASGESGSGLTL